MKKSILFISFFLIVLLAGCSQIPKANHITVTPTAPESVDYLPVIAANIGQPTTGMVYLENPNTKERTPFITVTDIYIEHYHNVEFHLGNLFIIRRFDQSNSSIDELWKYDAAGNGKKIYTGNNIDFRVAPDGNTIAINDSDHLLILDTSGNLFASFTLDELSSGNPKTNTASIGMEGWSKDSSQFWGNLFMAIDVRAFFRVIVSTKQSQTYDIMNFPFSRHDYDLNYDTAQIVFSDYPMFLDADNAKKFETSGKIVSLYLLDLPGKKIQTISTTIAKPFNPSWIDDNNFQYDNPGGDGTRINFALK